MVVNVNVNVDVTVVSIGVVSKSKLSATVVLMCVIVVSVEKKMSSIEVCCRLVPHLALVLARNDTMIPIIRQTDEIRMGKREKQ